MLGVIKLHPKGTMSRKGYYSPGLRRDLVKRLYFAAQEMRVPMTVLNDRLMEDSLNRIARKSAVLHLLPPANTSNSVPAQAVA